MGIPCALQSLFGRTLDCELALFGREGGVPPRLKPLLENVYDKIARREPARVVGASLDELLRAAGGRE